MVQSLSTAPFLSIMVDETTDISNKELVVVAHEEFIGLHQIESTQSEMLLAVVHNVLHRLNIEYTHCYGHALRPACSDVIVNNEKHFGYFV